MQPDIQIKKFTIKTMIKFAKKREIILMDRL